METNKMEFDIISEEESTNPLGEKETYTILQEKISKSPFRVVTHQDRITNSFWNNFIKKT